MKRVPGLIAAALLVVIDQLTKFFAARHLSGGPCVLIPGVLELRYVENHGAAFGILPGKQWFFILLTVVMLIAFLVIYLRQNEESRPLPLNLALIGLIGGAAGNLIDRVYFHFVRDFIYFRLIDFPVFNVADICVTVSAVIFIIYVLFFGDDEKAEDRQGKGKSHE